MNAFNNRVRSRLYKKGYQGFTQIDYEDAAIAIGLADENSPTKEELSKAVDYLIDKQSSQLTETDDSVTVTLRQQENITEEEPMQDDSKGEITFTNKFEKAGALERVFNDNGIVATDAEMLQMSGSIENTFDNEQAFIVDALGAWESYQLANIEKQSDEVRNRLASIRANEVAAANQMTESMNATAEFINGVRARHRQEFTDFIERMKRS
ncbi:MAG: hypothetical protein HC836_36950 [Richelia sp. RM2_1_2]|nr:hypothetical protein [Richelia sp. RM2_1_2]